MRGKYIIEPAYNLTEGDFVIYDNKVGQVVTADGSWFTIKIFNGDNSYTKECHLIDLSRMYFIYYNTSSTGDDEYRVQVRDEHYFDLVDELN